MVLDVVRVQILERLSHLNLREMGPVTLGRLVEAEARRSDVTADYVQLVLDDALCREYSDADTVEHAAFQE